MRSNTPYYTCEAHSNPCEGGTCILFTITHVNEIYYKPYKRGLLLTTTHVNKVYYSLQPM